ncbi:hypothetical protein E3N88_00804 [Mikania micrantha]|uniref:Terpene synthase N-terminal domain-containing protein n=1 Tax=Mikania micrantha TaxID=192012 RepID=A0A5N6Q1H0_9ASTR|nr:hypothetical protein E3N88_00804 [Mikania micrantha]
MMSPMSINETMSLSLASNSLLVDHHEMKVILPRVNVNNRINELKESTRTALIMSSDPTRTLELIDTIQRLGIGSYFKEEINKILEKMPKDDLYTMALHFRLRRNNGLATNPAEVFKSYMDANGELINESSCEDIEGLLSLYEASCVGSSGEDVLSHAKEVTKKHLNKSLSQLSPKLYKKVVDGLKLPRHMRMERLEARRYIEEYGHQDDHNPNLLEFAKYDYNMVQSVLQRELVEINRWWEQLGLCSKLDFIRDRHVECFLWTVGLLPEVAYSSSRIELAKAIAVLLVIDDVYDTYGSYDDLVLFTEAIERDIHGIGASFLSCIGWGYIRKFTNIFLTHTLSFSLWLETILRLWDDLGTVKRGCVIKHTFTHEGEKHKQVRKMEGKKCASDQWFMERSEYRAGYTRCDALADDQSRG